MRAPSTRPGPTGDRPPLAPSGFPPLLVLEEPTEAAAPEAKIEPGRIADSLAALSPETLSELKKSVEEIDLEATQRIIERISERDRALAEALGGLRKNFRFDILQELTKEAKQ